MSLPRYPKYKDSGVEWLGRVPAHWEVLRLGLLGICQGGAGFPDEHQGQADNEIPFFKVADISRAARDGALRESSHTVSSDTARLLRARVFPRSTIVFAKVGAALLLQRYRWLGQASCIDNNMMGLTLTARCLSPFMLHVLPLLDLSLIVNPGAVPSINEGQISSQRVAVPPLPEQTAIAAFLDYETAKIDALVAEQERLIELLKEKRQAVISHAVTKGLNPDVPMKDSGIEWLGEIPAHWSRVPVKRILEVKDGTHATPPYVDPAEDTFPLITSKDFGEIDICFDEAKHISAFDHCEVVKRSLTERGDVLMSMIGGNIGKAVVVGTERAFSIKNVALFKTAHSEPLARYLLHYLQSGLLDVQIDLVSRGGAQGFLGLGDIRNLVFFKIPSDEISLLVEHLESQLAPFSDLIKAAEACRQLMQERRTALISAAVTGQIDVREAAGRAA